MTPSLLLQKHQAYDSQSLFFQSIGIKLVDTSKHALLVNISLVIISVFM
jgi:hypothetical protein